MSRPPQVETFKAEWRGLRFQINWNRNFFNSGFAHLEIDRIAPAGAILPITKTGYRSHFIRAEALDAEGGPVAYVIAWLEETAKTPEWQAWEAASRQLTLF